MTGTKAGPADDMCSLGRAAASYAQALAVAVDQLVPAVAGLSPMPGLVRMGGARPDSSLVRRVDAEAQAVSGPLLNCPSGHRSRGAAADAGLTRMDPVSMRATPAASTKRRIFQALMVRIWKSSRDSG